MGFFNTLGIDSNDAVINWTITPAKAFSMFESWGAFDERERIRNTREKYYYFFIDNWNEPATLCLMERSIKSAKIVAELKAPKKMIEQCLAEQGKTTWDRQYAINDAIRRWLEEKVLDSNNGSEVIVVKKDLHPDELETGLPGKSDPIPELPRYKLRSTPSIIAEKDIQKIVSQYDFYESDYNPDGTFREYLVDNNDNKTVEDKVTNLTWQREGTDDVTSHLRLQKWIDETNRSKYGGYSDWRLPTVEEALSLLTHSKNEQGLHIHSCFAADQGYIFTSDQPGLKRYWFVDFAQAKVFHLAGTGSGFSGGFARLCRGGDSIGTA